MATPSPYEYILAAARTRVANPQGRFADEPCPFGGTWWPRAPTVEQQLASSFGMASPFKELSAEFFEELSAVGDSLKDIEGATDSAASQDASDESAKLVMDALHRRNRAFNVWDVLCFPVRRRGDQLFHISSPTDVMGTPIITVLHIDEYVRGVCVATAKTSAAMTKLAASRNNWRIAAIALGVLLVIALLR